MKTLYGLLLLIIIIVTHPVPSFSGERYRGFTRVNPKNCSKADAGVISRLPNEWQQYRDFVKVCPLRKPQSPTEVSIISIWTEEYFEYKYPPPAVPQWEQFPLPLIVDKKLRKIGSLPEIFPQNDVTSPVIYYGKWHNSVPTEIRVDVENPAIGGDYYYQPIVFNENVGRYELVDEEIKHGNR